MNLIVLIGRLTKEPEVRYSGQTTIARYTIAVDRRFKKDGQPEADFFNCTAFGKTAEFAENYLHKGTKIAITGELQNNNYTDKDGVKHYADQIIVNTNEFCESKATQDSHNDGSGDGFVNIPKSMEEELPFN